MKKKYIIGFLLILILSCFALTSFLYSKNSVYAEGEDSSITVKVQEITSLAQIDKEDGNYILKNDCELASRPISFKGTLDGNGHSIIKLSEGGTVVEDEVTAPLFQSLAGATIKNLNIQKITLKLDKSGAYANENVGILSGSAVGASISNVKIDDCKIIKSYVNADSNFGFLCGKMSTQSSVKNCIINNCSYQIGIDETISTKFNLGMLIGQAEDVVLSNNIINLYNNSNDTYKNITFSTASEKDLYFGGLVGELLSSNEFRIYNNVVIMSLGNFNVDSLINLYCGSLIGKMHNVLNGPYIRGLLTTYQQEFGFCDNDNYVLDKVTFLDDYDALSIDYFKSNNYWHNASLYDWDFEKIWFSRLGSKLPELQILTSYTASFNPSESDASLDVEILPAHPVVYGVIQTSNNNPNYSSEITNIKEISYESSIYISVKVSDENHYNKFFKITALLLNGRIIYDNQTKQFANGFDITELESGENVYLYEIKNFNANMVGEFTVSVATIPYEIDVAVYNVGTVDNAVYPGGVKSNTNSNLLTNSKITMEYGDRISLTSIATNKDYSDVTHWYLFNANSKDAHGEIVEFNLLLANENYKNNRITWNFTENCELFENNDNATVYNLDLFGGEDEPQYQFVVLFEKSVKEIEIAFKYENDEKIESKVATITIDGKTDRIVWDEEKLCYIAKIGYSQETEHIIKILSMSAEYEFDSWRYELGRLVVGEDNFSGIFELPASLEEDDDTEALRIYCVFKEDTKDLGIDLLWLWITLAGVGFIAVVIGIVIIIRRRGGGSVGKKDNKRRYYY